MKPRAAGRGNAPPPSGAAQADDSKSQTSQDFKPGIISDLPEEALDIEASEEDGDHSGANYEGSSTNAHYEEEDGSNVVVEYIASLMLKLESVHNVSLR